MKEVSSINTTNIRHTFADNCLNVYGQVFDVRLKGTKFGDIVLFHGNFYVTDLNGNILLCSKQLCFPWYISDFLANEYKKQKNGILDFSMSLVYEDSDTSAVGYHYTRAEFDVGGCSRFLASIASTVK